MAETDLFDQEREKRERFYELFKAPGVLTDGAKTLERAEFVNDLIDGKPNPGRQRTPRKLTHSQKSPNRTTIKLR